MCILDRSRYTACCEINHIFRTESEDLTEELKSFQEERELYSSFDLQAEISIIVYPSIFDSSICDLFLLLKHRYCFTDTYSHLLLQVNWLTLLATLLYLEAEQIISTKQLLWLLCTISILLSAKYERHQ